jgi:riboflavin synthase
MFTGSIGGVGTVHNIERIAGGAGLKVEWSGFENAALKRGSSVAIDGVCLSVETIDGNITSFTAVEETFSRSKITTYKIGTPVNLEMPLRPDSFIDGHIVGGHIDCTGTVENLEKVGLQRILKVSFPAIFSKYTVKKGSIAIDGISLTIADCGNGFVKCAIIPDTINFTTMKYAKKGDKVNIEFDIFAKFVEKFTAGKRSSNDDDTNAAVY